MRQAELKLLLLEEDRGPPGRSDFYWLQGTVDAGGYRGWSAFLAAVDDLQGFAGDLSQLAELAGPAKRALLGGRPSRIDVILRPHAQPLHEGLRARMSRLIIGALCFAGGIAAIGSRAYGYGTTDCPDQRIEPHRYRELAALAEATSWNSDAYLRALSELSTVPAEVLPRYRGERSGEIFLSLIDGSERLAEPGGDLDLALQSVGVLRRTYANGSNSRCSFEPEQVEIDGASLRVLSLLAVQNAAVGEEIDRQISGNLGDQSRQSLERARESYIANSGLLRVSTREVIDHLAETIESKGIDESVQEAAANHLAGMSNPVIELLGPALRKGLSRRLRQVEHGSESTQLSLAQLVRRLEQP